MKKIQKLLEESIPQAEVLRGARANSILKRWSEVVGPSLAQKSAPDRFDKGTVWVAVIGSEWASELRMERRRILARLNELSGEKCLFTDLRFGVRKFTSAVIEPPVETSPMVEKAHGSIREIGEKLIKKLQDEGRT